ncbi:hypothetical protein HHK36_032333 [Tetracentron sinense]|uniref:Uncharacterized protein n=1 Tax=Tetracentron sinense TaxID=13715 RepID=A0A835D0I8_TETSI|nr:hypothetical protein HHK36_032333 [Tetracentron sinense]
MISLILPLAFAERGSENVERVNTGGKVCESKMHEHAWVRPDVILISIPDGMNRVKDGLVCMPKCNVGDAWTRVTVQVKLRRSVCDEKNLRSTLTKAIYSDGFWALKTCSPQGIWSVREDLQVPSSPYFPAYAQGGQGPPPMVQERFQSVISQLFQYRIIRCDGAVDDDMANVIVAQLLYLDAIGPTKVCAVLFFCSFTNYNSGGLE